MKKTVFSVLKYLLFLGIGVGLLWLVTKDSDWKEIMRYIQSADIKFIIIALIIGILSHLFRALRWNLLINSTSYKSSTSVTFYSVMVGYLANMAIPRIGEITRCGVLSKTKKIPFGLLFGTVISERAFDLITLLALVIITISLQFGFLSEFLNKYIFDSLGAKFSNATGAILLTIALLLAVIALMYFSYRLILPYLRKTKYFFKFKRLLVSFLNGIKTILKNDKKWLFMFYTILIWSCYFLMLYVCFFTLDGTSHLTPIDGLTVMVIGSIGILAPVPGGIGAYHFIVIALLVEVYSINNTIASSFAHIAYTTQFGLVIIGGTISYLVLVFLQKRNKNSI